MLYIPGQGDECVEMKKSWEEEEGDFLRSHKTYTSWREREENGAKIEASWSKSVSPLSNIQGHRRFTATRSGSLSVQGHSTELWGGKRTLSVLGLHGILLSVKGPRGGWQRCSCWIMFLLLLLHHSFLWRSEEKEYDDLSLSLSLIFSWDLSLHTMSHDQRASLEASTWQQVWSYLSFLSIHVSSFFPHLISSPTFQNGSLKKWIPQKMDPSVPGGNNTQCLLTSPSFSSQTNHI